MNKKKIILIGSLPPPYHGTNISNERILKSKIADIFDVYHLDTSDHRDLSNIGNIDLANLGIGIKNLFSLIKLVKQIEPDLVYIPISQNIAYLRDGAFILIASHISKAKIIVHLRGCYFKKFYGKSNWFLKKFIDITMSKVDEAIVLGKSLKYIFNRWVQNCWVVPNGTDFNPDISKKKLCDRKNLIIGYLGNLIESKGVLDAIKAADIIINSNNYKNIKFKFAGMWVDKKFKHEVLEFIEKKKLDGHIEFTGFVAGEGKEEFLLDLDIFIFPSWNEGHPNVILEAMSAACPVISTKDVGAIPETVIDGKTGILIEKQSPKKIAKAILFLIENPKTRINMGLTGRKRFEENYTLDKNINNLIDAFEDIMRY